MEIYIEKEDPYLAGKKLFVISIIALFILLVFGTIGYKIVLTSFGKESDKDYSNLVAVDGNSLVAVSNPADPVRYKTIKVIVTGYSSASWQTDDTPFVTASGKSVEDGIIANNMLPFGTRVKIPELYGDKIFVVEDRMAARKGFYHVDVWFPDYYEAKDFGAKTTYIEVLES
jgi:3D (Asp-Asp-Asp) domain-containing protein